MLTCYIIDDELHAIRSLQAYIDKVPHLKLIGYKENPLEALAYFQQTSSYADITFLDVEMPQLSGLELASLLHGKTTIVCTTAHPNFALEAYEREIQDYLLKPFSFERFIKCITKVSAIVQTAKNKAAALTGDFIYIQSDGKGRVIKLDFNDIVYIISQKNYISIATIQKKYLTYLTLTEMEEKLPSFFLRISKSCIINTRQISNVDGNEIYLHNTKEAFLIGASYKEAFSLHIKDHLIKTKRH